MDIDVQFQLGSMIKLRVAGRIPMFAVMVAAFFSKISEYLPFL